MSASPGTGGFDGDGDADILVLAGANSVQPRPAVHPTEAAEQRASEMRLERSGVLLAYEIVF
jgi:hypothetical protein